MTTEYPFHHIHQNFEYSLLAILLSARVDVYTKSTLQNTQQQECKTGVHRVFFSLNNILGRWLMQNRTNFHCLHTTLKIKSNQTKYTLEVRTQYLEQYVHSFCAQLDLMTTNRRTWKCYLFPLILPNITTAVHFSIWSEFIQKGIHFLLVNHADCTTQNSWLLVMKFITCYHW